MNQLNPIRFPDEIFVPENGIEQFKEADPPAPQTITFPLHTWTAFRYWMERRISNDWAEDSAIVDTWNELVPVQQTTKTLV